MTKVLTAAVIAAQVSLPQYTRVLHLEQTSEDSANVSIGDLDADGDLKQ